MERSGPARSANKSMAAVKPAAPRSGITAAYPVDGLQLNRDEVIEGDQDRQQRQPEPEAPADQFFLDRQQRLDFRVEFVLEIGLRHGLSFERGYGLADQRRLE